MEIIIKPIVYICIIFLGAALKKAGVFKNGDGNLLSKIVMNFTLPAAIISSFVGYEPDSSLYLLIFIGLLSAGVPLFMVFFFTRKLNTQDRIYYMICLGGQNVGAFALPIMTAFFGPLGTIVCSMFDMGNAVLMSGGSYALTCSFLHLDGEEENGKRFYFVKLMAKRFFTSAPFDVYLLMLILIFFNIKLPEFVGTILSPIAASNSFLAMLMLGVMFQFKAKKSFLKDIITLASLRVFFSAIAATLVYFFIPLPMDIKEVLTVLCFAPIGSLASVFVEKAKGDTAKASCATTLSIIICFVIMVVLSGYFING